MSFLIVKQQYFSSRKVKIVVAQSNTFAWQCEFKTNTTIKMIQESYRKSQNIEQLRAMCNVAGIVKFYRPTPRLEMTIKCKNNVKLDICVVPINFTIIDGDDKFIFKYVLNYYNGRNCVDKKDLDEEKLYQLLFGLYNDRTIIK